MKDRGIFSESTYHSLLNAFRVMAGCEALAAILFCPESESTRFSALYSS